MALIVLIVLIVDMCYNKLNLGGFMGSGNLAKIYESTDSISGQAGELRKVLEGYYTYHTSRFDCPKKHIASIDADFEMKDKEGSQILIQLKRAPTLSEELLAPVLELLKILEEGKTVTLYPKGKVLTTQECADIIGCSRQHVVNLCNSGKLRFEEVGSHKKIKVEDLKTYRERRESEKLAAVQKMVEAGEKFTSEYGDDVEME